jgi:hypothetical protein
MISRRGRAMAFAGAVAAVLAATPAAAQAGTVRYTVPQTPAYAIQDNGNGIVKVTYNGCVTAGVRQQLSFSMVTNVGQSANAVFNVLKAEGEAPATTFTPPSVALVKGTDQTFSIGLAFTVDNANNGVTTFRIKLDPESGEGLGQGAGIMVKIPCVLAAPPAPAALAPGGSVAAGVTLAAPTVGVFPTIGSSQAASPARCISVPRGLRLRAGETTRVTVTVITNGQRIQGARVRATYPGAQYTKSTRADGRATFNIRPSRSGRLILQSDVCFGAHRMSVRAARVVARRAPARVTG